MQANASCPPVLPAQGGIQSPSPGSAGEGRDGGASALLLTCSPFSSLAASARYFLTDANYNVSVIVTDSGWGVERVFYTAYGEPEVFPFGDVDGDYDVDTADETLITAIKNGQAPYNILADLNLDGAVTQADLNAFSAYSGALGGRNVLTAFNNSGTTGNDIGYAGYTWNDERAQWHVRHREYDPKMGRFLQRDPIGHSSGSNFYQYADGSAATLTDSAGLSPFPPSFVPEWTLPNFSNGGGLAPESPGTTYWGMLITPGFDPSWIDWGGSPFPDIFNPLIAPGFDPGQYCKQPGPRYMARRGLLTEDEMWRAAETAGRYGQGFATLQAVGRPGDDNPYFDYLGCMANCLAEKLGEMPLRLAAMVFGDWVLSKAGAGVALGINVRPEDPILSNNPLDYVDWKRVQEAGEFLTQPTSHPYFRLLWFRSIQRQYLRIGPYVQASMTSTQVLVVSAGRVVVPPNPQMARIGRRLMRIGRLGSIWGWGTLGWDVLSTVYDAYNECSERCRSNGNLMAE